jgi:mannose-6-phosphate isomerase-like protein (cupin superfamily)
MTNYKFTAETGLPFGWDGISGVALSGAPEIPELGTAIVTVTGPRGKTKLTRSHIAYFVVSGEGSFFIDGKSYPAKPEDVFVIPPRVIYNYDGNMKLFEALTPAWQEGDSVDIKEGS